MSKKTYLDDKMFCGKCGKLLKIKKHSKITKKMLSQSYFFYEYGYCPQCKFFRMFEDKKVLIDKKIHKLLNNNKVYHNDIPKMQVRRKKKKRQDFKGGYKQYINSKRWEERKQEYYQDNKKQCSCCDTIKYIHLHHIVYGSFGNEKDKNLAPLCQVCHGEFHKYHKHNDRQGFEQFVKTKREYIKFKKEEQTQR